MIDYTTGTLAAFGTLIALQRRALYGGSYLVRVSLVQTATWLRGLGLAPESRLEDAKQVTPDEVRGWSIREETGFGPVTHLAPAGRDVGDAGALATAGGSAGDERGSVAYLTLPLREGGLTLRSTEPRMTQSATRHAACARWPRRRAAGFRTGGIPGSGRGGRSDSPPPSARETTAATRSADCLNTQCISTTPPS